MAPLPPVSPEAAIPYNDLSGQAKSGLEEDGIAERGIVSGGGQVFAEPSGTLVSAPAEMPLGADVLAAAYLSGFSEDEIATVDRDFQTLLKTVRVNRPRG